MRGFALLLLLATFVGGFSWMWVPRQHIGDVWVLATNCYAAFLALVVGFLCRDRRVWAVMLLGGFVFIYTAGCNAWFMVDPWVLVPEEDMCSTRLKFPVTALGLAMFIVLAWGVYMDRGKQNAHP